MPQHSPPKAEDCRYRHRFCCRYTYCYRRDRSSYYQHPIDHRTPEEAQNCQRFSGVKSVSSCGSAHRSGWVRAALAPKKPWPHHLKCCCSLGGGGRVQKHYTQPTKEIAPPKRKIVDWKTIMLNKNVRSLPAGRELGAGEKGG